MGRSSHKSQFSTLSLLLAFLLVMVLSLAASQSAWTKKTPELNVKTVAATPFEDHSRGVVSRREWAPLSSIASIGPKEIPSERLASSKNKYDPVRLEHGIVAATDVVKWVLVFGGVAATIILLFGFWNRSLNRMVEHRTSELRESESKFRRLNDANVVGIIFWNSAGDIIEANDEFLRMVGYTREEVVTGKVRWKDMTPPEYAALDEKALDELAATGITKNLEKEYFHKEGSRVPIALGAAVLEGSEDTGICYVQDLTQRKQVEDELKKSEERFRSLMEQSPLAIEILTPDGTISEVNAAWMRLWDLDEEEAQQVAEEYNMLTDQQTVDRGVAPLIRRAFAGEPVVLPPIEYVANRTLEDIGLEHVKGRSPWIQCHLYPVKNPDGEIAYVVNTYVDITDQKRAAENLKQLQGFSEHLIRTANVMIVSLDAEGRVTHFNPAAETITGYALSEVREKNWFELLVPRERYPEVYEEFERLMEGGMPRFFENPIVTKDGREKFISWTNADITMDGEIVGITSFGMDVTERRHTEEQLRAHQERLRALAAELTLSEERERRRIATELHDGAAQSLAFARMQLASACKTITESPTVKKLEDVSQILKQSLAQIREVLLDLSSPSMNEIGLGAAISEWLTQQIGRRHGLRTSFTDEGRKAPLGDDVRAVLFRNTRELLANVVKHAEADSVSVRIDSPGKTLRIKVVDNGTGFDPDRKFATTEARGFGLFSIRERMLDLGGSLEIVSAPGKGCEATLVMPLDCAAESKN